ncbi:MAG TPA: motility protein MotB, partial [Methylophilaceae bacterium]|nr:motility protein MotB [Methylophilaceae bacterium]
DKGNPYNPINRRISIIVMNKQAELDAMKDSESIQPNQPPATEVIKGLDQIN